MSAISRFIAKLSVAELKIARLEGENARTLNDLHTLRARVEEADTLAIKVTTEDGTIAAYHFSTGAWHRLLAEARKGDRK